MLIRGAEWIVAWDGSQHRLLPDGFVVVAPSAWAPTRVRTT
jgi:hypothetical protein